nr:roadblock/LC7 domain-containing protein [Geotalea sp. SG265]
MKELVESVPGSTGAILADWEGEAVEQYCLTDTYELKVTAAHQGIIISQLRDVLKGFPAAGELTHLSIKTESQLFIVGVVGADYSLVMTMETDALRGRAERAFARATRLLVKEIY